MGINSLIGIETLVDIYELMDHNIVPHANATWIDYLYWREVNGSEVCGVCKTGDYAIRLDCQHIERYDRSTLAPQVTLAFGSNSLVINSPILLASPKVIFSPPVM